MFSLIGYHVRSTYNIFPTSIQPQELLGNLVKLPIQSYIWRLIRVYNANVNSYY